MSFNTGATFFPGGDDAYYMPEVVAPAPQRIGENPTNMQQNVASFEQQAQHDRHSQYVNGLTQNADWQQQQTRQHHSPKPLQHQHMASDYSSASDSAALQQSSTHPMTSRYNAPNFRGPSEVPNFSPFPPLRNAGPNIPPTDEQKEAVLEQAREPVLACQDPEQQLTWAQDALSYCEVAMQNEARISRTQQARPRTPRMERVLKEDALKVTNFLADQNHPKAQFMRGMWYEFGKFGYPIDKPESFQCYKRAADRGYVRAWYRMGMQFESGNDPLAAIKYYRLAAEQEDSAACYRLGMLALLGQHGQPQDFNEGLKQIYAAAQTADDNAPQGAFVLGMLQAGKLTQVTVPEQYLQRDIGSAKINIERAAFLGFAKAQVEMGLAYELGELGCPFDPTLSLHYNCLAARQGETEAEMAISKWFLCGYDGLFEKNEELAFTYAQRAALDGLGTAQFAMGYFYEVGIYVNVDLKEAKEWYRKADESGNKDANKRIEAVSRSKTISRKDHEKIYTQRIRDQHGGAPQSQMPNLPEVPSPSLDMPDPSRMSLYDPPPQQRVTSTAPYPAGPSLTPRPSIPEFRPTSAFGINPNLRPISAVTMPVRPESYAYNSPTHGQGRPYPGQYPEDNYGRRPSGPPAGHLKPQQRPVGRPASASPHASPHLLPQGPPNAHVQAHRPDPPSQTSSAPNVNLGFSAPIDTQGADRPNWSPRASGAGEGPRPPPGPHGRNDGDQLRGTSGLPSQQSGRPGPSQGYQPNPNRPQQQANQPRPPQPQQPPKQQLPPVPNVQPAQVKPSKPSPAAPPAQQKPQSPQKVKASQIATRPGKGPKTFAEMGIPQQQEDKDCIVM